MKKISGWLFRGAIFLGILYLLFLKPIPMYLEIPGGAFGLNEMVEVDNTFAEDPGEFYLTTVGIQQATPFTALSSVLPFRELVSEKELFGEIEDFEEYNTIQQFHMDSSINTAIQIAFEAADREYQINYNGVYVLQVLNDSSFADELQVGDVIKSVDDNTFQNANEFIDYIGQKDVGEEVSIEYERDQEFHTTTNKLVLLESGAPGIGVGLVDQSTIETNPAVTIHSGQIGGPSAGLMFSLQIYNQLIEENIRDSYKIAGTGTINPDGTVGRISGIDKKVVAADKKGASYFFAPDDEVSEAMKKINPQIKSNYQEALEAAEAIDTGMEIIPVKEFSDAVEFLEQLDKKEVKSAQLLTLTNSFISFEFEGERIAV